MHIPFEDPKYTPTESDNSRSEYNAPSSTGPPSPPPYTSTLTPQEPVALEPLRTNRIYVKDQNNSVKGSWTIDPDVKVPEALLAPIPDGETRENLYLRSHNGSVVAKIRLISDEPTTRSTVNGSSQNGSVTLKIVSLCHWISFS